MQNVAYSPLGDVDQVTLARSGAAGVRKTFIGNTYEEGTRRLLRSTVNDQTHNGMLQELTYNYDQAGNVLSIFDSAPLSGFTKADNQCFTYDAQRRMTEAWTPKTADCSTAGRTAANLDGAAPYWNSYTYTASGQRATEKTNTGTPQTRTYCYDPARPHALAATTTGATCTGLTAQYTYDKTGNTTKRAETPGSPTSQTLAWSPEGKLAKTTEGTTATDYVYDADGQLLIRRDPAGETVLYAGANEVHLKGTKKWATRSYGIVGAKIAVLTNESGTAKLSFVAGDGHGTSSLAVSADDTQTVSKRYTTPFGAPRGPATTTWPDDKRFLDKPQDTSTGLTHIGAREYDPALGQFISIDPLLSTDLHQSLNGYSYANNNPATYSDPTGLREMCGASGNSCYENDYNNDGTNNKDGDRSTGNGTNECGNDPDCRRGGSGSSRSTTPTKTKTKSPVCNYSTGINCGGQGGPPGRGSGKGAAGTPVGPHYVAGTWVNESVPSQGCQTTTTCTIVYGAAVVAGGVAVAPVVFAIGPEILAACLFNPAGCAETFTELATGGAAGGSLPRPGGTLRSVNPTGSNTNCAKCSIATDLRLQGKNATAGPGPLTDASDLEAHFGSLFRSTKGRDDISRELLERGNGARGIVYGFTVDSKGGVDWGHFFNAVNDGGNIKFLDGQAGGYADLSWQHMGYMDFMYTGGGKN
ncbi:RHS repeat-associated core domain-containing protein [Streptomyces sp. ICC4]|uniref:RHS repeat-associated core domain-containing protein n=1 Tax=Streptomyces sp. ICC4 TaxID=2099584 RepID=UPI001EF85BED|nr:RHS repeat-associated core domain-containing protein [Streptomyces sp. ICC4]